jgi:3-hydroxyisobutyrate dehydrogenase-like beta-hydroxyacid dehydrogenase
MKTILAAIALSMALSGPAMARQDRQTQNCADIAELAEAMMLARQGGVSLATAMEIAASDPTLRNITETMARMAWSETRWLSVEAQRRAVSDFRDRIHLLCLGA